MKVVIAGGGTAGHVFPAIAVADALRDRVGARVSFIGSPQGQEAALVPNAGYEFVAVEAAPLPRQLSIRAARAPLVAIGSIRRCRQLVRDADAVVGMGGYVSVPAVLAARRERIPVVLHEQNAIPGLANRLLARRASAIGVSFESARSRFPSGTPVSLTGNPVRAQVLRVLRYRPELAAEARRELDMAAGRTTVLVTGGSLGALHLDRVVAGAIELLADRADLQLLILTGPDHLKEIVVGGYSQLIVRAFSFLDRMELAYALADLVISRAGATSVAEVSVCGLAAILVPYPHATENHQLANARELERAGAAEVLLDADLSAPDLANRIARLVADTKRRQMMSEAALAWSKPEAALKLAALVEGVFSS
jgi:UDP-N-acetylglucosamine--N-acetylmuramyl-(pentapeptide) pyrophosphoryl-undecaprenol N-acetylglucosamine transferase